jgi:ATP-dependent DNA ligase
MQWHAPKTHRLLPAGFVEPCLPTLAREVPAGPQWAHEIKHDGYRMLCRRDGDRLRVFSRWGKEWTERVPTIVAALQSLPVTSVRHKCTCPARRLFALHLSTCSHFGHSNV